MSDASPFEHALRQGTRLLHAGKTNAAIIHLKRAHKLAPKHVNAAINLAGAYILASKFSKAVPILEDLAEREAENPMVWINLGAAYLGNPILATDEQQLKAIAAFERALEFDPQAHSVHYNLGLIYRDRGEREKAVAMFHKALEVNRNDHDARNLLKKLGQSAD